MAFTEGACNNEAAFVYFPRFSSTGYSRNVLAELFRNPLASSSFDHELASPSGVESDEILEQLNDENYYSGVSKVSNDENDGQIQFKRILQRPENPATSTKFGAQPKNYATRSPLSQRPTFTRIVKRTESYGCAVQKWNRHDRRSSCGEGSDTIRPQRDLGYSPPFYCAFCESNGETCSFFTSHPLKDAQNRVICPILQRYTCPKCGATGQSAHTIKYCPQNTAPLPKYKPIRRNAIGKRVVSYN